MAPSAVWAGRGARPASLMKRSTGSRTIDFPGSIFSIGATARHRSIASMILLKGWSCGPLVRNCALPPKQRSEEHTSELQSLMRISYAVFCLKKKIKQQTQDNVNRQQKSDIVAN